MENWATIHGYEGLYEVSDLGRVRSLDRVVYHLKDSRIRNLKGRVLKPGLAGNPGSERLVVNLSRDGKTLVHRVHRLVALAWVPGNQDGFEVCHTNGDGLDNRAMNLRWDTSSENHHDTVRHGNNPRASANAVEKSKRRWKLRLKEMENNQ